MTTALDYYNCMSLLRMAESDGFAVACDGSTIKLLPNHGKWTKYRKNNAWVFHSVDEAVGWLRGRADQRLYDAQSEKKSRRK